METEVCRRPCGRTLGDKVPRNARSERHAVEVTVLCALLPLLAACMTARADRPASRLVDARGNVVGEIVDLESALGPIVALREARGASLVRVRADRLTADGALNYESSDCSGTPFVDSVSTTRVGSFLLDEQCYVAAFDTSVVPVRSVLDLAAAFSPPFTLAPP